MSVEYGCRLKAAVDQSLAEVILTFTAGCGKGYMMDCAPTGKAFRATGHVKQIHIMPGPIVIGSQSKTIVVLLNQTMLQVLRKQADGRRYICFPDCSMMNPRMAYAAGIWP